MVMKQIALRHHLLFYHHWDPKRCSHARLAPLKHRWCYAGNSVGVFVNFDFLAHYLGIRAEMRLRIARRCPNMGTPVS
jgi:hypothetical protein